MKQRDSFVSNSSSSSFIIIGERASMMELTEKDIEDGVIATGKMLGEGTDVFTVSTMGMLKFIQDHCEPFILYKNAKKYTDSDIVEIDIEGPCTVVGGTADQNNSWDIDRLFRNYEYLVAEETELVIENAKEQLKEKYK